MKMLAAGGTRLTPSERWLLLAFSIEIALFSLFARGFFGWTNFFEVLRFSIEIGLLTIALTPVIITGGIDLSVGSTVGLTAVVTGELWSMHPLRLSGLLMAGLLCGLACGAVNAIFIAGLRLPPLIVTLGTYSLYRGIAEGITHGAVS